MTETNREIPGSLRLDDRPSSGTIVVAGIPRSGTTMMLRALAGLEPGTTTPPDIGPEFIKTHSFSPASFTDIGKAVFLFGDPVLSVLSTKRKRMTEGHFRNCGAGHLDPETTDIFSADVLNYEKMFDSWMQKQTFDLMCLRYETLWENLSVIDAFFGRPVKIPDQRHRGTKEVRSDEDTLIKINNTYKGLIEKIRLAPDVSIYRAG